jgi:SAM-dependent methyltransferase
MDGFTPETSFGPDTAATYDDRLRGDEQAAAAFLHSLNERAHGGPALELAIGTGRIALPLAERGVEVDGIELSQAMIEQLRNKPGGRGLYVVAGDMCNETARGPYSLAYLVYNTLGNVLTQEGQVQIFRNVARQLTGDGVFVVETAVPWAWVNPLEPDYVRPEYVAAQKVVFDVVEYDPVTQLANENHVTLDENGIRFGPIAQRVVSPAEMDLMAQLAGMRLRERFGGWGSEPFTKSSTMHVSVYEKAPPPR